MTQLARIQPAADGTIVRTADIDVASLLRVIVDQGVTSDSAAAVKELVLLHEHRQDRDAKQQFIQAYARARANLTTINATKGIPDKNGGIKWYYTPLEELQDAVEPVLDMEGLTLRFDSRREGNLCIGICWLYHTAGHSEKSECGVNAGNCEGGDLGAMKKAKRGALTAMLGLKTRHMGDDAAILGDCILPEQAESLRRRVETTGSDQVKFLKMAGAKTFAEIRLGKYGALDSALTRKERQQALGKAAETGPAVSPAPQIQAAPDGA